MATLRVGATLTTAPAGPARGSAKGDADAWTAALAAATGEAAEPAQRVGRRGDTDRGEVARRDDGKARDVDTTKDPRAGGRQERVHDDKRRVSSTNGTPAPLAAASVQSVQHVTSGATQHARAKVTGAAAPTGNSRAASIATGGATQTVPGVDQEVVAAHVPPASQAGKDMPANSPVPPLKDGAAVTITQAQGQRQVASAPRDDTSRTAVSTGAEPGASSLAIGSRIPSGSATDRGEVQAAGSAAPRLTFVEPKKLPSGNAPQVQTAGVALGVLQMPATTSGGGAQPVGALVATVPSRSDVSANAQALGSAVAVLHQGGLNAATVHLTPPTLGSVQIQIQVAGGHAASIAFIVSQPSAAQAVQASLPQLTQALQQHGITLAQASVSTGDGGATWNGQSGGGGQQPWYGHADQGALVGSGRRGREATEVVVPKGVRAYA